MPAFGLKLTRLKWLALGPATLATLTVLLSSCQTVPVLVQRLTPLPQHSSIQAYFNQRQASAYTEPDRQQTRPGDNLEQVIVQAIEAAQSTLDVAVQELRSPLIAQALVKRQAAGVRVRLILENTYSRPWSSLSTAEVAQLQPRERERYQEFRKLVDQNQDGQLSPLEINQRDALQVVHQAAIPWLDDRADGSAGSGLMHHKFVVVDQHTLLVTSANFTPSDLHGDLSSPASRGNANSLVRIQSSALAASFTREFNQMWGDGPGGQLNSLFGRKKPFRSAQQVKLGDATVKVQFSPTSEAIAWESSVNGLIGQTLSQAKSSVDLALFVFSDQQLANTLAINHQRGVEIRALIEPSFAYRSYSEALDLLGVALTQDPATTQTSGCKFEAANQPWQVPITTVGVPQLPQGDLLHHKFGIVDRQTVIMGSHNWSDAANSNNDETLLVINSPTVAAHYVQEFERLYRNAELGLPETLERQLQAQQAACGSGLTTATLPTSSPTETSSSASTTSQPLVNLNTASQQDLEALPGVGPKVAERIIQARQAKPFTALADLDQVPGVGPRLLKALEGQVTW